MVSFESDYTTGAHPAVLRRLAVIVCRAAMADLAEILAIYAAARARMRAAGNPAQWGNDRPKADTVMGDIEKGQCYLLKEGTRTAGVFVFFAGPDPTYRVIFDGAWPSEGPYGVIHRVAAAPGAHGVLAAAVQYAAERVPEIRIDTHRDNRPMQGALQKQGFIRCSTILTDDGTPRLAFYRKSKP